MTRLVLIVALAAGACGRSDSSKSEPEATNVAPAAIDSAWWPTDEAAWRSIKGECSSSEADESWCQMPSPANVPLLAAFLEGRPSLVLALTSDPALGGRVAELIASLLVGDPQRGAGRVGGIASGAIGVVTVAMLEGWPRPGPEQLGSVLRAVVAGVELAQDRGGPGLEVVVGAFATRSEVSESDVTGDTAKARMSSIVRRAWADAIVRESDRLRVDIAAEPCDRARPGAENTLGCRHEVMSASLSKMLADVFGER